MKENLIKIHSTLPSGSYGFPSDNNITLNQPVDKLRRPITDLRISLIDQCNFRCTYCMPKEIFDKNYKFLSSNSLLSFEEVILLSKIFIRLGVRKIRLTGGEPLLRKDIEKLIAKLKNLRTISGDFLQVTLTTNGQLLKTKLESLKTSGLDRITVSLDALDKKVFSKMTSSNVSPEKILNSINLAKEMGLNIKVNMVVKKGVNDNQIIPMAKYFKNKGITLRFIEFMDVGSTNGWKQTHVFPSKEITKILNQEFGVNYIGRNSQNEVSETWTYSDKSATFGTISSVSNPFCGNCTRARISSNGILYTCLFSNFGYNIKKIIGTYKNDGSREIEQYIYEFIYKIWTKRKDKYSLERNVINNADNKKVEMSYIGG